MTIKLPVTVETVYAEDARWTEFRDGDGNVIPDDVIAHRLNAHDGLVEACRAAVPYIQHANWCEAVDGTGDCRCGRHAVAESLRAALAAAEPGEVGTDAPPH